MVQLAGGFAVEITLSGLRSESFLCCRPSGSRIGVSVPSAASSFAVRQYEKTRQYPVLLSMTTFYHALPLDWALAGAADHEQKTAAIRPMDLKRRKLRISSAPHNLAGARGAQHPPKQDEQKDIIGRSG